MVVRVVEEEEVCTVVPVIRFQSDLGWKMGGGGAGRYWWDCMADNIRLGKEEEEALHREGNNDDINNGYREGGGGGGGG